MPTTQQPAHAQPGAVDLNRETEFFGAQPCTNDGEAGNASGAAFSNIRSGQWAGYYVQVLISDIGSECLVLLPQQTRWLSAYSTSTVLVLPQCKSFRV